MEYFIANTMILIANILVLWITIKLYTEILKNMLAGKRREGDEDKMKDIAKGELQ